MPNELLFSNGGSSNLAAPIASSQTTAQLTAGTGALFPNPGVNQSFRLTFIDSATRQLREIVNVTSMSGDNIESMTRGVENTTPQDWNTGDIVQQLVTAGSLGAFQQGAGQFICRIVTNSGGFTINTSDYAIGLQRTTYLAASFSTLPIPANLLESQDFWINDLSNNFQSYPVTIYAPANCLINGQASVVLNFNGGEYHFRYWNDGITYSAGGPNL